jgi:heme exporter protein D
MFGKHAAYIIPSYVLTVLVIAGLLLWILATYRKRKSEIAALEAKGIKRGAGGKQ